MDNQAEMTTRGNLILPPGTDERPLVTFALFAYNQEKYIREAIEGAFSQTYTPLEIILSDDFSSDRTFETMQKMAAEYKGPHKVIVRRNAFNLGTAVHVQSVFAVSSGELFVVAAGDDISTSDRVAELTNAWVAASCPEGVVNSGREIFCDGKTIGYASAKRNQYSDRVLDGYAYANWLPAAAPTCAYTRGVFELFDPLLGGSIIEDMPLLLRAALIGHFVSCDRQLVRQRVHENNSGTGYRIGSPANWNRFIHSKFVAFRNMQKDLASGSIEIDSKLQQQIERRILAALQSVPGLLLPETRKVSRLECILLAFRMIAAPAVSSNLRTRIVYTLDFFGLKFHRRFKGRVQSWNGGAWRIL